MIAPRLPLASRFLPALLLSPFATAVPVAVPDDYDVPEDRTFIVVPEFGVLENDFEDGPPTAVLENDVSHGVLLFNGDGSFSYTPDPDFSGIDSFTYHVLGSAPQVFTVDQANSNLTVSATVNVSGVGSDSDSDSSSVTGTVVAAPSPGTAPFSTIHITDLDLSLADSLSLNFSFAFGLAGVDVTAAANSFQLTMDTPGPPAAVAGDGTFTQTNNLVDVAGTLDVDATGLADGLVPEGPQVINLDNETVDIGGTITQNGNQLVLVTDISFSGSFDVGGNPVDLDLDGTIRATSPVAAGATQSNTTTVSLHIQPRNDAPSVRNESYFIPAGSQLVRTAADPGGTDTLVSAGATWRYLVSDTAPAADWTELRFDDRQWPSGPAQLGFGEGDEATEIGFGGDANDKNVTTWFRHTFEVNGAGAQGDLHLRLLRDDGAAVYLNGVEVVRNNLNPGADADDFASTAAVNAAESFFYEFHLPASLLVEGDNILAVELHQASAGSSDLSFDLELVRERYSGGVLGNDSDAEFSVLTAEVHTPPANGNLQLAPDGSFTYTPDPGFTGTDTFIYRVLDGTPDSALEILPFGSVWSYLDDGSDQGTGWREPAFDDSSWDTGRAELGYGEVDQETTVGFIDTTPQDPANVTKNATTYFRRSFFVGELRDLPDLELRLLRDDAAAVYLNGTEIYRDANLDPDAAFNDYATSGVLDENAIATVAVQARSLVPGENVLAVEVHQSSATSSDVAFDLALVATVPGESSLVPLGSTWRFLDNGDDLQSAWSERAFDDSIWIGGPGVLGFGNGNEDTLVEEGTVPRRITTYFRTTFQLADKDSVRALGLDLVRDDGAAIYLNGSELVRDNLAAGAAFDDESEGTVGGPDESRLFHHWGLDPALLVDGANVLAVEVHQASDSSSDLSFDLRLNGILSESLGVATIVVQAPNFPDSDADGMDDDWETANGLVVGVNDAANDDDGDGDDNLSEFLACTDPQDAASSFRLLDVTADGAGNYSVEFTSVPGKRYRLQVSTDLIDWTDLAGAETIAIGPLSTIAGASLPVTDEIYFRVVVNAF